MHVLLPWLLATLAFGVEPAGPGDGARPGASPDGGAAAPAWAHGTALAIGTPDGEDGRIQALRDLLTAGTLDDDQMSAAHALAPILAGLADGQTLPREVRIQILETALVGGPDAGRRATADAYAAFEADPASIAENAWVSDFVSALAATRDATAADAIIDQALLAHPGSDDKRRLATVREVMELLPSGVGVNRERARPLIAGAMTFKRSERSALRDLLQSVDGQYELVRLGAVSADRVRADNQLSTETVYWWMCASRHSGLLWNMEEEDTTTRDQRRARKETCDKGEYFTGDSGWTLVLGDRALKSADELLSTALGARQKDCRPPSVQVDVTYTMGPGSFINGVYIPGAPQAVPVMASAAARPSDCMPREEAEAAAGKANAGLARHLDAIRVAGE